jgi:small subunit ribosomal protein YMR-31
LSNLFYLGKADHTPKVHPQSPSAQLPASFAAYRSNAQIHGPLGTTRTIQPGPGEFFARTDLANRFHYLGFSDIEMDNINSGGADVVY